MKSIASIALVSCVLCSPLSWALSSAAQSYEATSPKVPIKINLNKASIEELAHSMKGIGKKRAEAIVAYRQQHGPFKSLQELALVRGFGAHFVHQHLAELQALLTS